MDDIFGEDHDLTDPQEDGSPAPGAFEVPAADDPAADPVLDQSSDPTEAPVDDAGSAIPDPDQLWDPAELDDWIENDPIGISDDSNSTRPQTAIDFAIAGMFQSVPEELGQSPEFTEFIEGLIERRSSGGGS